MGPEGEGLTRYTENRWANRDTQTYQREKEKRLQERPQTESWTDKQTGQSERQKPLRARDGKQKHRQT